MQQSKNPTLRRNHRNSPAATLSTLRQRVVGCVGSLVLIYLSFLYTFVSVMNQPHRQPLQQPPPSQQAISNSQSSLFSNTANEPRSYADWRKLAVDLAKLPPAELLAKLEHDDPFGVRALAKMLENVVGLEKTLDDIKPQMERIFACPPQEQRLSFPDQRNATKAQAFRRHDKGSFIFFQHLRKAGGTNYCTLAGANIPKKNLPSYFCMPDYYWHHEHDAVQRGVNGCAGCLHRWSNQEILQNMNNYWIAGNEWDSFDPTRHLDLPAVFVTSFRRPLHRALSQFRFECLEHRGCKFNEVEPWWEHRRDLYNVYTWTFSDVRQQGRLATSTAAQDIEKRSEAVGTALDVVVQFHLILVMEYLRFASPLVEHILGFTDTSVLTQHVRPHNGQIQRKDSLIPEEYLSPDQYRRMSETLALDEILTDAAQRIFWERLLCKTY